MNGMKAEIRWLTFEEGGRRSLPTGPMYVAPAKFLAHSEKWGVEDWSLVVEKIENADGSKEWLTNVWFGMEDAPHEWLSSGSSFELYEGCRCVGIGRII